MTYWTLATSSINDNPQKDETVEWESEFETRNLPKMKFPVKMLDNIMDKVDLKFTDPKLKKPKAIKVNPVKEKANVIDILNNRKSNKKGDKNKLF